MCNARTKLTNYYMAIHFTINDAFERFKFLD